MEQEVRYLAPDLDLAFVSRVRLGGPPFQVTQSQYPARVKVSREMVASLGVQCLSVDWVHCPMWTRLSHQEQSPSSQAVRLFVEAVEVQIVGVY